MTHIPQLPREAVCGVSLFRTCEQSAGVRNIEYHTMRSLLLPQVMRTRNIRLAGGEQVEMVLNEGENIPVSWRAFPLITFWGKNRIFALELLDTRWFCIGIDRNRFKWGPCTPFAVIEQN